MDNYGGIYVINEDGKDFDIKGLLSQKPAAFAEKNSHEPQILIYHTHTTESFNMNDPKGYNKGDLFRSENEKENIVRIGEIITKKLTAAGYNTIHSKTVHDKDFNHSYTSSNKEILKYLNQYPSIKIVIDVHRDTLISDKGTRYKPVVDLNGEKSAQVMLLMAAGNPTYQHPNWHKNFCFALHLQKTANELFPGLMRPILLRDSRYNQHLCTGGMLAEIGADANSLQEAERAADYFADALIALLNNLQLI